MPIFDIVVGHYRTPIILLLAVVIASALPIFAHHGNAAYDETHPITLKGTVTEFEWANPHAQIYFDVKDQKGNTSLGVRNLGSGKARSRRLEQGCVKPGNGITISFIPAKNGAPVGILQKIVFASGKQLGIEEQP